MSLKTISFGHLNLVGRYWNRYVVRSGSGLVYLLIALIFGLSVAQMIIMPVEKMMEQQIKLTGKTNPQEINEAIEGIGLPIIEWVLGTKEQGDAAPGPLLTPFGQQVPSGPWSKFLVKDRPALLSAIFLVLVFGMPFAISFLAFNQVSGDIQSRGLRYLLLRTERSNIYFGRFLGSAVFSTLVMAFIVATITFYLGVKLRIYSAGSLFGWAVHGFLALSILMLPYIALCSMISVSVDSSFLSLVLAKLTIGGVLLFAVVGKVAWEPMIYFKFVLPWGVQNYLLHPELIYSGGAALACLGYTTVFLMLGYYRFETRDL